MSLSHDKKVAEVFVLALFLGMNLITFGKALRWLLWADEGWKLRRKIDWIILFLTGVIFGITITRAVFLLRDTMILVMKPPDVSRATEYIKPVGRQSAGSWTGVTDCILANSPILLSDAVFLYRLWLVYNKYHRVIVFPALLWLGALVCTILRIPWDFIPGALEVGTSPLLVNMTTSVGIIMAPFWGATMVLNIYATVMMTRRIWRITKETEGAIGTHSLRFLMRVFIESGCIYIIVAMSHFITWLTPSEYALSLVATMNTPMTGIAFNLITIRTYENSAMENLEKYGRPPHVSTLHFGTMQQQSDSASATHTQPSFEAKSTLC